MSNDNNVPKVIDDPNVSNKRGHIEQRAEWFYLLIDEARKHGHGDWEEIARAAINRCGCIRGAAFFEDVQNKSNFKEIGEVFVNSPNGVLFEREMVRIDDDGIEMHFHYCPLVNAWRKLTDDDKLMEVLCDIAMDGDRGMFSNLDGVKFTLDGTIAEGKPYCRILLTKDEEK